MTHRHIHVRIQKNKLDWKGMALNANILEGHRQGWSLSCRIEDWSKCKSITNIMGMLMQHPACLNTSRLYIKSSWRPPTNGGVVSWFSSQPAHIRTIFNTVPCLLCLPNRIFTQIIEKRCYCLYSACFHACRDGMTGSQLPNIAQG